MTDRLVDPTRQGIASNEPEPEWAGRAKPVTLAAAVSMVDAWGADFAPFQMHQMCRALREGLREAQAHSADLQRQMEDDDARLGNLRRENESLRFRAGQSGVPLVDGPDMYGSRIGGYPLSRVLRLMDVWRPEVERWGLHQMCRVLRQEYEQQKTRALAALPCSEGRDTGFGCLGKHHPWAACCNLRVALLPGEPFPTDYLKDAGMIHLFEPQQRPDAVRVSAGCVKLIEPTIYERNEALDWDARPRRE